MSKKQFFTGIFLAAILGGLIAIGIYKSFETNENPYNSFRENQNIRFSNISVDTSEYTVPEGLHFVYAANQVTPAVVHIKSSFESSGNFRNPLEELFDLNPRNRRRGQGFGSGVIISEDGYITTNNHVIDNADEMEVTLNNGRKFKAKLIGTDPTTDLALIKIDAKGLPYVNFGDSDKLNIGEWVLAIGNPYDLTSTVTAGIVSAKGRSIGILRDSLRIESFIQTDAAVNPGNSGGALVNLKGELIGINTAIASPTGSYSGYSFAVPVSLVGKVMDDLLEFGAVQRALLGVTIADINAELAEEYELKEYSGVYVEDVSPSGAAMEAGMKRGDIIVSINEITTGSVSELQEQIALKRPGDKITVDFIRNGKKETIEAILKSTKGTLEVIRPKTTLLIEGATFENLDINELETLDLKGGVKISSVESGKWKSAGIREDYIITSIDKIEVNNVVDLKRILNNKKGETILLLGVYPDGEKAWYSVKW